MARRPEDWRRRLTGRRPFEQPAAEAAIRAAYRASGLAEPARILWAKGPSEAVRILRFLAEPPRRQRWISRVLMAIGAAIWAVLALCMAATGAADQARAPILMIAAVLGFYLVREAARVLPPPPGMTVAARRSGAALVEGAVVLAAMLGALAWADPGPDAGPAERLAAAALAALAGALPGALLLRRLAQAYRGAPREVCEIATGRSVARAFWRARRPFLGQTDASLAAHPYESLARAHQSAYGEAFLHAADPAAQPDRDLAAPGLRRTDVAWLAARPRAMTEWTLFLPVPHLDGIAEAPAVQSAEGKGPGPAQSFADLAFHVDRLFPYRNLALAVRPPSSLSLDAEGRPHAEGGPALAWADGSEVYAWGGRVVERSLVCTLPLTPAFIAAERDPDRQAVLIERYGLGRYLADLGARAVQSDSCGELYRLDQRGEPIVAVHVVNASPEPDGSFRDFWLRVPPTVRTAREAVAWTFGLSAQEYQPIAQS